MKLEVALTWRSYADGLSTDGWDTILFISLGGGIGDTSALQRSTTSVIGALRT